MKNFGKRKKTIFLLQYFPEPFKMPMCILCVQENVLCSVSNFYAITTLKLRTSQETNIF